MKRSVSAPGSNPETGFVSGPVGAIQAHTQRGVAENFGDFVNAGVDMTGRGFAQIAKITETFSRRFQEAAIPMADSIRNVVVGTCDFLLHLLQKPEKPRSRS